MNAHDEFQTSDLLPLSDAQRSALEVRWYDGKMLRYVDLLTSFAARHRAEILRESGDARDSAALCEATQRYILHVGSVHMPSELTDQKIEMENECWYRGQEGRHDRADIMITWAHCHGRPWREWRLREYLFVVDRCAEKIVAELLPPAASAEG
ncbi:MAG: hypothetical protein ABIQ12_12585 [Opitutaceae bacterium]